MAPPPEAPAAARPPRFDGAAVVVTGAASGIGAASARRFAAEGAQLVLADIDEEAGRAVASELGAQFERVDVTVEAEVAGLVAGAAERLGRVDVLFNNAGIMGYGTLPDLEASEWHRVLDIDLNSVFYGCRAGVAQMRGQGGGGAIVNTASISGLGGDYATPSYNAAKAAVVNFTRAVAIEQADSGIRVNCVCPGPIETPMTAAVGQVPGIAEEYAQAIPMGRLGTADEVATTVLFLASDEAAYVTGAALVVDGGLTACTGQPNFRRRLGLG